MKNNKSINLGTESTAGAFFGSNILLLDVHNFNYICLSRHGYNQKSSPKSVFIPKSAMAANGSPGRDLEVKTAKHTK